MRKQAVSTAENLVSIRVPKKLAGKRVVLVDAAEYAALTRRLSEVSHALEMISRGDAAYVVVEVLRRQPGGAHGGQRMSPTGGRFQ